MCSMTVAEGLPEETTVALQQTAVAVYQALELRDYGRIDMRLKPDGRVAVIEANPNPWLASKAEFALAARKSGRTYTQLIGEIVELALARYGAGTTPSCSTNSAKPSSEHLNERRCPASGSVAATANIFPPTLNTRSAPH